MLESGWLFTGLVLLGATSLAVLTDEEPIAVVMGVIGFVAGLVWTYGTLDVRVVGDAVTYSFTMPSLTLLGIALTLVPLYTAWEGGLGVAKKYRDPRAEEL